MRFLIKSALVLFSVAAFTACKKEKGNVTPDTTKPDYGTVKRAGKFNMYFHNVVNGETLRTDSTWYLTDSKDSFTVSAFSYYISNIVLHTEGGSLYVEPNSYHLIRQEDPSSFQFTISDVPPGRYDSLTMMIGIDAEKSASGDMTGPFDPKYDRYWNDDWGFIMAKLEGTSPHSKNQKMIKYHVGGYKGLYIANRTVGVKFQKIREIDDNAHFLSIDADAARFFYGEYNVRLDKDFGLEKPGPLAVLIADNYKRMFAQIDR